jgi:hypothetical protein
VRFWVDGVYQGTDSVAPYSWSWNTTSASNGSHRIQLQAVDAANNATTLRRTVNVSNGDTTPPALTIMDPGNGQIVSGTFVINAVATDAGGVSKVRFWTNWAYQGADASSPYAWSWDTTTLPNGAYWVQVQAVDNANNATTQRVWVYVIN